MQILVSRRYVARLVVVYLVLWLVLAIQPHDRHDWLLENALVLEFGLGLWASRKSFVFSRVSYTLIFVYLCLHAVGAHYTYAEVPYESAWQPLTGQRFHAKIERAMWRRRVCQHV